VFVRSEIIENVWWPSGVLLVKNYRKRLEAIMCFLDKKSWKMHGGHQALFGSKKNENIK
jgi:hypothetical protein